MHEQLVDFIEQYQRRAEGFCASLESVRAWEHLLPESPGALESSEVTRVRAVLRDRKEFTRIRTYAGAPSIRGRAFKRQGDLVYRLFLSQQADLRTLDSMNARIGSIRESIEGFRCDVGKGPVGWEDVWPALRAARSAERRRGAWMSLLDLADDLAPRLLELVAEQNRVARSLGIGDYSALASVLEEIDRDGTQALLQQAAEGTAATFDEFRRELDLGLESLFRAAPGTLGPWHLPHPMRLLPAWEDDRSGPLLRVSIGAAAGLLERWELGVPAERLPDGVQRRPGTTPWDMMTDTGRALRRLLPTVLEIHAGERIPRALRVAPSAGTCWTLWYLLVDELTDPAVLADLKIKGRQGGTVRARLRESLRRDRLVLVRIAHLLARFERALYSSPGQDTSQRWWDLAREHLGIEPRDAAGRPGWAVMPELLNPAGTHLHRALGAIGAAHVTRAITGCGEGSLDADGRAFIRERLVRPAPLRPLESLITTATGNPLSVEGFVERACTESRGRVPLT